MEKVNFGPYLTPRMKSNLKFIIELNVKSINTIIKIPVENIRENLNNPKGRRMCEYRVNNKHLKKS